jgi:hypothetical protein
MNQKPEAFVPGDGRLAYHIGRHQHLFAAWAASRAASVKGCRFKVRQGREILESSGFTPSFCQPDQLPAPTEMEAWHRQWRNLVIGAAKAHGLSFTHGVAAKLINVYMKSRFACGGHHEHERVRRLHPPIDDELLKALIQQNVGGQVKRWREARRWRWSKFTSDQYEQVIALIRQSLNGQPLWMIEEHWKGNQ